MGVTAVRVAVSTFGLAVALLAIGLTAGQAAEKAAAVATGSGILIGAGGEVLTNAHVVEDCRSIELTFADGGAEAATLLARDEQNDLAVVRGGRKRDAAAVAAFREAPPLRAGDSVVALGYPLAGVLATGANLTVGNVSALAGLRDDSRYIQMSAPTQPGNSGGPLLDTSAHVVGIVTAKLDAVRVARAIGDVPQNVNFALKAQVARTFLDSKLISYQTETSTAALSPADVGEIARPFTVHVACSKSEPRVVAAAAPSTSSAAAAQAETASGFLKGPLRDAFVERTLKSCNKKVRKDNPDVPKAMLHAFCSCLAEGEADATTAADVAYADEHRKASDGYVARINKIAATCKTKVGSR